MVKDGERERLLAGAILVVLSRGLDVSNRELAAEIGTSHRMLDYYFGGRQGLISAVLDSLSAQLMSVFEDATPPPEARRSLAALVDVEGDPALGALWQDVLLRAARGEPEYVAAAERIGTAWHTWLMTSWGLDSTTAEAAFAAYEGSGVVAIARGEAAGREALRRLLTALDERGDKRG